MDVGAYSVEFLMYVLGDVGETVGKFLQSIAVKLDLGTELIDVQAVERGHKLIEDIVGDVDLCVKICCSILELIHEAGCLMFNVPVSVLFELGLACHQLSEMLGVCIGQDCEAKVGVC